MRKHFTRLLTTLLALVILLPIVAQAAPTDGWTDEAEQAYQTVTQLVIQRVTESKDYLATAILLAVIVAALLAFGMVRRYRRIKKEQ